MLSVFDIESSLDDLPFGGFSFLPILAFQDDDDDADDDDCADAGAVIALSPGTVA